MYIEWKTGTLSAVACVVEGIEVQRT